MTTVVKMSEREILIQRTGLYEEVINHLLLTHPETNDVRMKRWNVGMRPHRRGMYITITTGRSERFFTWIGFWNRGRVIEEYFMSG